MLRRNEDGDLVSVETYDNVINLAVDRDPWEHQPGENSVAWALFQAYRDLVPTARSAVEAYRIAFPTSAEPLPATLYGPGYARRFRWEERAAAYDHYFDEKQRIILERQRIVVRVETAQLGRAMRLKAQEALTALSAVIYTEVADPTTGQLTRTLKSALGPAAIAQLAKTGSALERFALGLEQSAAAQQLRVQVAVGISTITPEADQKLLAEAAAILQARKEQFELVMDPEAAYAGAAAAQPLAIEAVAASPVVEKQDG